MVVRREEVAARTERARAIGLFGVPVDPRGRRSAAVPQGAGSAGATDRRE
jgi:hypothetical protein